MVRIPSRSQWDFVVAVLAWASRSCRTPRPTDPPPGPLSLSHRATGGADLVGRWVRTGA